MSSATGLDATAVALLATLCLAALAIAVLATLVLTRRKLQRDVRELVATLEHMRGGRGRGRPDVPEESPLGSVADSVHRLGQDLNARWHETARTAMELEALRSAAPDTAVVATDDEGTVRSFNEHAEELFGWGEPDVVGRPASMLFPEDAWRDLLPALLRRDVRTRGLRQRATLLRRDGRTFVAELSLRALRREGSEGTAGFLVALRDVDDRVVLERRLALAEERQRHVLERLTEPAVVVVGDVVARANPAAGELFDDDPEALAGVPFHRLVATREVLRVRHWIASGAGGDLVSAVEVAGGEVEVGLRAAPVDHEGEAAVLILLADRTAERRLQRELRRNEERLDAVIEATTDGILVLADAPAPARAVVHVLNRSFLELFGLRQEDVLGVGEEALLRVLKDRGAAAARLAEIVASAGRETLHVAVEGEGDPPRELEVHCLPLRGRTGGAVGRMLAIRDRTASRVPERRLEERADELREGMEELRASYERLDELNRGLDGRLSDLDRLNTELRRLDEMKSQLLANVSHELQTPLVSIRGYTEMIAKGRLGPVTDEQRKGLDLSLRNIDRLISMIDGLLEFSRMEREAGALELSEFPLEDLIEECRETLQPRLDERGIAWSVRFAAPDLTVHGDRAKLRQVLFNLASNAVKFNRDGGRVEITVERKDEAHARIHVHDTGRGIAQADLDRIFDRYYRADEVADGVEGTGLGLAIVRNLLRLHGCTIRAESPPGEGATFTFTLPLVEGDGAGVRPRGEADGGRVAAAPDLERPDAPGTREEAAPEPGPAEAPDDRDQAPAEGDSDAAREDERPRLRIIRR